MKLYDDLGKFVHGTVLVARPVPGYVGNTLKEGVYCGISAARPAMGYVANGLKEGICMAGEGARFAVDKMPVEQAQDAFVKARESWDALDESTKAKIVFGGKCTAGAAITVGGATIVLPVLGFCATGVKAGSLAAAAHSMIGNVAAGSTFSLLQSAGVLGFSAATNVALGASGAAAVAAPTLWPRLGPWKPDGINGGGAAVALPLRSQL